MGHSACLRLLRCAVLGSLLALLGALLAAPAAAEATTRTTRVLVELQDDHGPVATARQGDRLGARRAQVLDRLAEAGARPVRTLGVLPYVVVEVASTSLGRLRSLSGVLAVEPDRPLRPHLSETVPHVGGTAAWSQGATGDGQLVAVLDTGVDAGHPTLAGAVVEEACFSASGSCPDGSRVQTGAGAAAPCRYDEGACGHGTHVAGIVAGRDPSGPGVARGAGVVAVQVFSRTTSGCPAGEVACAVAWTSDLVAGLDHVAALAATRPVAAVNLSLGGGRYTGTCDSAQPSLARAVDLLRGAGVLTVASSGNDAEDQAMGSPACLSGAVAVGASSRSGNDAVISFSNSSAELDLLAPGEAVLSAYPDGRRAWMSGTSQAAPHVAGAVAVLRSGRPGASAEELAAALTGTGVAVVDARNGRTTPRLQVDAALRALAGGSVTEPAPVGAEPVLVDPEPAPEQAPVEPEPAPVEPEPAPLEPAPVGPAPAEPVAGPSRLAGPDRWSTAAEVFGSAFGCSSGGAATAVVARGDAFPDALSGAYLAGAERTGVLLTAPGYVPAATLQALRAAGVRSVTLLGGTTAVSDAVVQQLAATPAYDCDGRRTGTLQVRRLAGVDRYDTARAAALAAGSSAVGRADLDGSGAHRTAVVASGTGFADVLAAGPLSWARGLPTLLTATDGLRPEVEAALRELDVEQVLVPGGPAAVGTAVTDRLHRLGYRVVRVAGAERTETAVALAALAVDRLGFDGGSAVLARGDVFADALAGAAWAGARGRPLVLSAGTDRLGPAATSWLLTREVTVLGGAGAVSDTALASLRR